MAEPMLVEAIHFSVYLYIGLSIGLLLCVRSLRLPLLYLLKNVWCLFTLIAFVWALMMSGATNQAFMNNPSGVLNVASRYPEAFSELYGVDGWWLVLGLMVLGYVVEQRITTTQSTKRVLRLAYVGLLGVSAIPLVVLTYRFDWAPYANFSENYRHAWSAARMGDYFFNSVLVSITAVGLVSVIASMAAYALSRFRFSGRRLILTTIIAAMALPGMLLLVPLFLMIKDWTVSGFSFANSRFGLSIIYAALSLPFTTFLLVSFYRTLPTQLAKAAVLDGASSWKVFSEVYFPLTLPGLATTAIFNFLAIWNEYHFALVFLTNANYKTLPVGLYNLHVSQQYAVNWPAMFAGLVILVLPTFLIFVLLQERIVAGLTIGALKG